METPGGSYTPPPSSPVSGGPGTAQEVIYPTQPPKNPIHVLLLNAIAGCVGYFMIGQKLKGIIAVIAVVLLVIPTCGTVSLAIVVVAMIDGYLQAQQLEAGHPIGQWTFFNQHR